MPDPNWSQDFLIWQSFCSPDALPDGRMLEIRKEKSYKLFWSDCKDGNGGVGIMIDEIWIDNVIDVMRASERIILLSYSTEDFSTFDVFR